jgi:hypothetical protein
VRRSTRRLSLTYRNFLGSLRAGSNPPTTEKTHLRHFSASHCRFLIIWLCYVLLWQRLPSASDNHPPHAISITPILSSDRSRTNPAARKFQLRSIAVMLGNSRRFRLPARSLPRRESGLEPRATKKNRKYHCTVPRKGIPSVWVRNRIRVGRGVGGADWGVSGIVKSDWDVKS